VAPCPLLLFLLCLPILDYYGFSFFKLFRKYKDSPRHFGMWRKQEAGDSCLPVTC
jgi:hypothetical protein